MNMQKQRPLLHQQQDENNFNWQNRSHLKQDQANQTAFMTIKNKSPTKYLSQVQQFQQLQIRQNQLPLSSAQTPSSSQSLQQNQRMPAKNQRRVQKKFVEYMNEIRNESSSHEPHYALQFGKRDKLENFSPTEKFNAQTKLGLKQKYQEFKQQSLQSQNQILSQARKVLKCSNSQSYILEPTTQNDQQNQHGEIRLRHQAQKDPNAYSQKTSKHSIQLQNPNIQSKSQSQSQFQSQSGKQLMRRKIHNQQSQPLVVVDNETLPDIGSINSPKDKQIFSNERAQDLRGKSRDIMRSHQISSRILSDCQRSNENDFNEQQLIYCKKTN